MHAIYYRNRIDIIASILEVANGNEVKQVEILNKANITHTLFKECLFFVLQYGLIEYIRIQRTYRTTTKGILFLSICDKMKNLI
jgi:predicted transcriptional regulator